jgi:hypothetical protein
MQNIELEKRGCLCEIHVPLSGFELIHKNQVTSTPILMYSLPGLSAFLQMTNISWQFRKA